MSRTATLRSLAALGLLVPLALAGLACAPAVETAGNVGEPAPEISGLDLDGESFQLSDFRGKVVVLDFWGDWWGPCRSTYPHLRALAQKHANDEFAIVGVDSDTQLDRLKHVMEKQGIRWRSFTNGPKGPRGPIARAWGVEDWPTICVLDAKGVIRYRSAQPDFEAIGELVEQLLENPDATASARK